MSDVITLHVDEPQPITLDYIEAKIKPEVVGHATPTKQAQTVTPAPGTTFSAVEVDAIPSEYIKPAGTVSITENGETDVRNYASALVAVPQPSGKITITENGTGLDIADYAEADVNVQPNLQTPEPITPTEQQQIITPGTGYDGIEQAVVEPIPSEYIVPSGKITLTENATDVDISQYAAADIAVPVPVMPDEYAIGGSLFAKTLTGYKFGTGITSIQQPVFSDCTHITYLDLPNTIQSLCTNCFGGCIALERISLSSSLTEIKNQAFYRCASLVELDLPDNVSTIPDYMCWGCDALRIVKMPKNVATIWSRSFQSCTSLQCLDFTKSESIPTYGGSNMLYAANPDAKIVVPDALVTQWKAATNWVTYADKIIGESDYNAQS